MRLHAVARTPFRRAAIALSLLGICLGIAFWFAMRGQPVDPGFRLEVQLSLDGSLAVAAAGPAGSQVLVIAGPPWQGHEDLPGGRVSIDIPAEQRRAGAGVQLQGLLGDQPLSRTLAPDRVAALPSPLVFQAICTSVQDGKVTASLSNAFVFERDGDIPSLRAHSVAWSLRQLAPRLLLLGLALPMAAWLIRRCPLRRGLPATWLPLAAVGLLLARIVTPTATPLLPSWPRGTESEQLAAALGERFTSVLNGVRNHRVGAEPVVFVLDGPQPDELFSSIAHWFRLLPDAVFRRSLDGLPATGIVVLVAGRVTGGSTPALEQLARIGRQLQQTPAATIWRLGDRGGNR